MSLNLNRADDKKEITEENSAMARDLRWAVEEALNKFEKEIADYAEWTIDDLTDLRQRVADLEEEVESKDEQIESLEAELARSSGECRMSQERETYIQQTCGDKDLSPPQGPGWEVKGYFGGDADCWPNILWVREPVPDAWQDAETNAGDDPEIVSSFCSAGFEPMGPWRQYAGPRDGFGGYTHWRRPLRKIQSEGGAE